MPAIIGIVLVVLIAFGVGGYFFLAGGSGDAGEEKPPLAMARKWNVDLQSTTSRPDEDNGMRAMWLNDDEVIFGGHDGVRAYNRQTGKQQWELETPKGAGGVCALPAEPSSEGVGAAVFDAGGGDCSYLSVFDSNTGRTLWVKNLKGRAKETHPHVGISREYVAVAIGDTYAGFSVTGGVGKWQLKRRGHHCMVSVGLSAEYMARVSDCSDGKPQRQLDIQHLDLDSISANLHGEKLDLERIVSDEPLTLLMTSDDSEPTRVLQTYTTTGDPKPDKRIELTGDLKELDFVPRTTMVDGDAQVLVTTYGNSSGTAAVDLKSGKLLWKRSGAAATALDGENAIVVGSSKGTATQLGTQDPQLLSLGLRDGKEKVLGTLYDPKHDLPSATQMSVRWNDNEHTLYIEGNHPSGDAPFIRAFQVPGT
ncbi:PQQ-binding-like beta-propeller repeat protein [Streptomyces sp. NPDC048644]|uniref:outer membrane protein assembly factor BamB family protein n=1 Tax=Streptomyces sp. NPDC048644 TaxID=3365582 RepID=UPI0037244A91